MKKKAILISLLFYFLAISGYSYNTECNPCCPCPKPCNETPKTNKPCNCAYNAPARIDPACGYKAWGSINFIYWQTNCF